MVDAAFNEAKVPMESLEWRRSGISYGFDSAKITEEEPMKRLIAATQIAANGILLHYLPMSLELAPPARNMPAGWLALLSYSNNIIINIKTDKGIADSNPEIKK